MLARSCQSRSSAPVPNAEATSLERVVRMARNSTPRHVADKSRGSHRLVSMKNGLTKRIIPNLQAQIWRQPPQPHPASYGFNMRPHSPAEPSKAVIDGSHDPHSCCLRRYPAEESNPVRQNRSLACVHHTRRAAELRVESPKLRVRSTRRSLNTSLSTVEHERKESNPVRQFWRLTALPGARSCIELRVECSELRADVLVRHSQLFTLNSFSQ